jgi:hypothetical protein
MTYKDKVFSRAWLNLPWVSRFQILFTGKIHVETIVETENMVGRTLGNTIILTRWPIFRKSKTFDMESPGRDEDLEKVDRVLNG